MQRILPKKWLTMAATLLFTNAVLAQQDPYYSFNMFNRLTYNPGYAGGDKPGYTCITMASKKQWAGGQGTPTFENINISMPITRYPKDGASPYITHGIGLSFENDKLAFESGLNLTLAYAFRLRLPGEQYLSFGPSVGLLQKGHEGDKLKTLSFLMNSIVDPNVPVSAVTGVKPDFNFGAYYGRQNLGKYANFYAGLGVRHLVEADIKYQSQQGAGQSVWEMRRNIYLHSGLEYGIGNNTLQPSVLIRSDMTKLQLELSANYLMNDKYWVGGAYRHGSVFKGFNVDAMAIQGGLKLKPNLKAGLAYDLTLNRMLRVSGYQTGYGSVEIMVQYCFKPKTTYNPKIYRDTRRLNGWQ